MVQHRDIEVNILVRFECMVHPRDIEVKHTGEVCVYGTSQRY